MANFIMCILPQLKKKSSWDLDYVCVSLGLIQSREGRWALFVGSGRSAAGAVSGTRGGKGSRDVAREQDPASTRTLGIITLILQHPHVISLLLLNDCQGEGRDLLPRSLEEEREAGGTSDRLKDAEHTGTGAALDPRS